MPIIDPTRPTTNKNAIVAENYRLLKVDTLDNRSISEQIARAAPAADRRAPRPTPSSSAISATGCSTATPSRSSLRRFRPGVFRVADSQVASRWGNILEFEGFDLITPNEREARFALGDQDSVIRPLALELHRRSKCKTVILKCGDRGIITYRSDSPTDFRAFFTVDSLRRPGGRCGGCRATRCSLTRRSP